MTVTLIHGDCLTLLPAACPDPAVIVTDPPYGTGKHGYVTTAMVTSAFIAGDLDTSARDRLLDLYPNTPAIVFGSLQMPAPKNTRQVLVYRKPLNAGAMSARAGWRRDIEGIYLVGPWPVGAPIRSSVVATRRGSLNQGGLHPHEKPVDVIAALLETCPPGLILDPFAGSGTTLVAAQLLGRDAVGIEVDEKHHATARARLAQDVLA